MTEQRAAHALTLVRSRGEYPKKMSASWCPPAAAKKTRPRFNETASRHSHWGLFVHGAFFEQVLVPIRLDETQINLRAEFVVELLQFLERHADHRPGRHGIIFALRS